MSVMAFVLVIRLHAVVVDMDILFWLDTIWNSQTDLEDYFHDQ